MKVMRVQVRVQVTVRVTCDKDDDCEGPGGCQVW